MRNTLMGVLPSATTDRVGRYPKHTFQTNELPFTAQPFFFAPVLPGETMENLYMESRVVTDPILNSIIGWKKEYYYFYCPMSILGVQGYMDMFVDPTNTDLTASLGTASNDAPKYRGKGSVNWIGACLSSVVDAWFRDEDTSASTYQTAAGIPLVQIRENTWLDSITDSNDFAEGAAISGATDAGDLDRLMDAFEMLRAMGVANMDYEDWLRTNGIAIPDQQQNRPEIIARFADFQYPSNTIDPTNGTPRSAVSWVFKNGQKKNKFFKEPGFIIGISVTRPKIYFAGLTGSLAGWMGRAWDWSPNYLWNMPETTLKEFAQDTGPLGNRLAAKPAYWVDMRDLLIHGDQFQNLYTPADNTDPVATYASHLLPLPGIDLTGGTWKYPTEAMCKGFFVDAAGTKYNVKQDGYVSLSIKGKMRDMTQGNFADM